MEKINLKVGYMKSGKPGAGYAFYGAVTDLDYVFAFKDNVLLRHDYEITRLVLDDEDSTIINRENFKIQTDGYYVELLLDENVIEKYRGKKYPLFIKFDPVEKNIIVSPISPLDNGINIKNLNIQFSIVVIGRED